MLLKGDTVGRRATKERKQVIGLGKRTNNVCLAVRMALKEIMYIRKPRTEANNNNMKLW